MKEFVQLVISASMFFALPLAAVDEHHAEQQDGATQPPRKYRPPRAMTTTCRQDRWRKT